MEHAPPAPASAPAIFAEVLANADSAVFVVDADGRCLAANEAAAALSGYSVDELCALPAGALNAYADEGSTHRIETARGLRHDGWTHLLRSDGTIVDLRFVATPTQAAGRAAMVAVCWAVSPGIRKSS